MEHFFKLKENGTTVSTEITAGLTTFFTMAYIIIVNPTLLSQAGMEWGAVFLATIIASIIGTLVMALFANLPYAQAPGMGLNAFFVYTVCFVLGFTWQQALSMVFLCGLFNILLNAFVIPAVMLLGGMEGAYWYLFGTMMLTETIWVYAVGTPLYFAVTRLIGRGVKVMLPFAASGRKNCDDNKKVEIG